MSKAATIDENIAAAQALVAEKTFGDYAKDTAVFAGRTAAGVLTIAAGIVLADQIKQKLLGA